MRIDSELDQQKCFLMTEVLCDEVFLKAKLFTSSCNRCA